MAYKSRDELVGKRFISVRNEGKLKVGKISEWEWRSGFVRAVSTRDSSNADFTVLIEFDDAGWKHREYVKVHEVFQEFLVEHTLSWVKRKDPKQGQWPALSFKPVVDKAGLFQQSKRPVEFLSDRFLGTVEEKDIVHYRAGDESTVPTAKEYPDIVKLIKAWTDYQDGQKILLTTPTVLLGYRVEVYRTEGTTQWYTAVIKSYNHTNKSLTLTDDTVLEEHNEDPTLIQMHLIGDGVVESILNGVDVGVAQRRRPRSTVTKQSSKDSPSIISVSRGATNVQISNVSSITSQVKYSCSGVASSSSPSSPITVTSLGSGKNTLTKTRAASDTLALSWEASSEAYSEVSSFKGQGQQKNQKQISKRKPDPPTKAAKKFPAGKKIKKSASNENFESSTSVCKQTCNVLVKRIEEENKKHAQAKEKPRPPRLRDNTAQNKKPPDLDDFNDGASLDITCLVNNSESQKEPSQELIVRDKGDRNLSRSRETKIKEKEEVKRKGKYQESSNVSLQLSGKDVNPSVTYSALGDAEKNKNCNNTICDTNINSLTSTKPSESGTNHISNSLLASANLKTKEQNLLGSKTRKNETTLKSADVPPETDKNAPLVKKVASDLVRETSEKDENSSFRDNTDIGSDKSDLKPDEDMHYKKQILRAEGNISPPQSTQVSSFSEGIDVNRSLTDQLAKRNKNNDKLSLGLDEKSGLEVVCPGDILSSSSSLSTQNPPEWERPASNPTLTKPHDFIKDRHSAFTYVQSSLTKSNTITPAGDDRADSRASDGQLPTHISEDKRPGSRLDDIRSVRSSPGSSPLVIDRYEAVNPYRDPELMRKNPVQSNVQNILAAQQKMSQPSFPAGPTPVPGASVPAQTPAAFAGVPPLPARSLLSTMPSTLPYTSSHQLPPSISHHLTLSHTYSPMDVVVRAQQQQLAAIQQQQLMGYPMGTPPPAMATLEALWQRKFPSTPLPAHWMLQKNQESLLTGDLTALHREHIHMQMEQERRERERREVERRELERERLEQERREKERKDLLERERQEKEKAERDKIERIERERLEKERLERQEWEHKQNQERILRASVDTVAAVDQHFAESLTRLASQQDKASKRIRNKFLNENQIHQQRQQKNSRLARR